MTSNKLTPQESDYILEILKSRFEESKDRLKGVSWMEVRSKLEQHPDKVWSINQMEKTGGEPNVLAFNHDKNEYTFCDFSKESPAQRRSLCYDQEALAARKKYKPADSAKNVATKMGIELMNEEQYRLLQSTGEFDTKTSSWLETPKAIRGLGGAIFGDFRYGQVFIYHNGADSYYAARGFRGILKI